MAYINWDAKPESCPPGMYLAEVADCEITTSKKNDEMFVVDFKKVRGGGRICKDWIMLTGKMAFAGIKKLELLGFAPGQGQIMAHELIGRRCYLAITQKPYKDMMQPSVDSKAQGFKFGYRAENDPPAGTPDPEAVADVSPENWDGDPDKTPF